MGIPIILVYADSCPVKEEIVEIAAKFRGSLYEEKDIQIALDFRYLKAMARKQGMYGKGPKPYTTEDRAKFVKRLSEILSNFAGF